MSVWEERGATVGIPIKKAKRKIVAGGICILGILFVSQNKNVHLEKETAKNFWLNVLAEWTVETYAPVFEFVTVQEGEDGSFAEKILLSGFPFLEYEQSRKKRDLLVQDEETRQLLLAENEMRWKEEEDELEDDGRTTEDEFTDPKTLAEAFERENQLAMVDVSENEMSGEDVQATISGNFVPNERQKEYNWDEYQDFQSLFTTFYAMDSNTMVGREQLNIEKLLTPDMTISKEAPGPQILIYHTHSQEAFADSVPGDASTTIVGAGEKLKTILEEQYGYSVLHHTGEYDVIDRDGAYGRSLPALEQLLSENPNIQVVIDLHRDGVSDDRRLVTEVNGRTTAQFMFFNGLSRSKSTGDIEYLKNPYLEENLAFAFQMKVASDEYYPGLARRNYLNAYRYNMHLRPKNLLIELGAQTNTVEEIMNAIDPLAHILDLVLSGQS